MTKYKHIFAGLAAASGGAALGYFAQEPLNDFSIYKRFFAASAATSGGSAMGYLAQEHSHDSSDSKRNTFEPRKHDYSSSKYHEKILASRNVVKRMQTQLGIPGMVVAVSINGKIIWNEGFGMANVETQTPCHAGTKMRIASISKPITMTLLAKLVEDGLVDLDKPIQEYVPYFPKKLMNKKSVTITPRLLACHKSGIRHYRILEESADTGDPEFYSKERFKDLKQSVDLFKDDELLHPPGEKYVYSTHGFTLLSAVIEGATKQPFDKKFRAFLEELGLKNTHLDEIPTIVYERASYYARDKNGHLVNAELSDNSYKWAGGGLVSNTTDLLKFANIMLMSYQNTESKYRSYLKADTVKELWTSIPGTGTPTKNGQGYGLGWQIQAEKPGWVGNGGQRFHVGHAGGAVGASSFLLISPRTNESSCPPNGIAVAIIANLQRVSLIHRFALEIAEKFEED